MEEKLEFEEIKSILERYIETDMGRYRLSRLTPVFSLEEAEERFRYLKILSRMEEKLEFCKIDFGENLLREIKTAKSFTPVELMIVKDLLVLAKKIYKPLEHTGLKELLRYSPHCEFLIVKIENIIEGGEIRESASPLLKNLREEKRRLREEIISKFEDIKDRFHKLGVLREGVVTLKNGRIVLAFKANSEYRGVVHGYSSTDQTVYVEPFEVVELQNRWLEVRDKEEREEKRILRELSNEINRNYKLIKGIFDGIGELEVLIAKLRFKEEFHCIIPAVNDKGKIDIANAYNPILVKYIGRENTVPLTISLSPEDKVLLISGPNAGGKTVVLKTVGLLTLMASTGIPIIADRADIFIPKKIYTVGFEDGTNIREGESSFTCIMKSVKEIIDTAPEGTLILFDEMLNSTSPEDGSTIGFSLLKYFKERGAKVLTNTHFTKLKLLVEKDPEMLNARMEFDSDTGSPTYRLVMGGIGESYAFSIAKKVGIPEDILSTAERYLSEYERDIRKAIEDIKRQKKELKEKIEKCEEWERSLKEKEGELEKNFRKNLKKILLDTERSLKKLISEARSERKLEDRLRKLKDIERSKTTIEDEFLYKTVEGEPIVGRTYRIKKLGFEGELVRFDNNKAYLRVGNIKVEVTRDSLCEV